MMMIEYSLAVGFRSTTTGFRCSSFIPSNSLSLSLSLSSLLMFSLERFNLITFYCDFLLQVIVHGGVLKTLLVVYTTALVDYLKLEAIITIMNHGTFSRPSFIQFELQKKKKKKISRMNSEFWNNGSTGTDFLIIVVHLQREQILLRTGLEQQHQQQEEIIIIIRAQLGGMENLIIILLRRLGSLFLTMILYLQLLKHVEL